MKKGDRNVLTRRQIGLRVPSWDECAMPRVKLSEQREWWAAVDSNH